MNAEDILAMQRVTKLYSREHMFRMIVEREDIIREALDAIAEQEMENEECALEELLALSR